MEIRTETLVAGAVVMLGAMAHGMTGFGFALVAAPILMMFEDARAVIVTTLILGTILNALLLVQSRGQATLRDVGFLMVGSLMGVPVGAYMLIVLSAEALRLMVAVLALLFSVPLLIGYSRTFTHHRAASLVTGTVSGALQGSVGMGGPPVVLFMANEGVPKDLFRRTLVLRAAVASALSVLALVPSGTVNTDLALQSLVLVPALLIGFWAGCRLVKLVPQLLFKRLTVVLICGTALVSLAGSLM